MVQITKALLFVAVLAFTTAVPVAHEGMAMVAARTSPGAGLAGNLALVEKRQCGGAGKTKRTNSYPCVAFAGDPDAVVKRVAEPEVVEKRTNSYPGVALAGDVDIVEKRQCGGAGKTKRTNSYPCVAFAGDPDAVVKRTPIAAAHAVTEEVDSAA